MPSESLAQQSPNNNISDYQDEADRIIQAALDDDQAFDTFTRFVDLYPHRLSGSQKLENAIDWILAEMRKQPFDRVSSQKVMVPHWVRGEESATLLSPYELDLPMLGLGGSVATPDGGIEAEVLVVENFEDLHEKADQAEGKIVVYNIPFDGYGKTVKYRYQGGIEAAKVGAVASLIRSLGPYSMQTPHTGNSSYEEGVKKIPQGAITPEHAMLMHRLQKMGQPIKMKLSMNAQTLPDAPSRNVLAEIKGSEHPEEVIVLGGHIDAWDVGQGAMDDAGGCFAAWEAVMLMKKLGLKLKRTVRVVMWTNEENGLQGGTVYRDSVKSNGTLDDHVLAIESDSGVFDPRGFGFSGSDAAFEMITKIGKLLDSIDSGTINKGGGGADIGPIMREGVPGMGLEVDGSRYFWYHHSPADTIDKLDEQEYKECIATLAVMAYVVADMPERLPK